MEERRGWREGGRGGGGALSDICIFKLGIELWRNVVIIHPQLRQWWRVLHWIIAWSDLWSDPHLLSDPAILPHVYKYLCWSIHHRVRVVETLVFVTQYLWYGTELTLFLHQSVMITCVALDCRASYFWFLIMPLQCCTHVSISGDLIPGFAFKCLASNSLWCFIIWFRWDIQWIWFTN